MVGGRGDDVYLRIWLCSARLGSTRVHRFAILKDGSGSALSCSFSKNSVCFPCIYVVVNLVVMDVIFVGGGCVLGSLPFVDGECVGGCCPRLGEMVSWYVIGR